LLLKVLKKTKTRNINRPLRLKICSLVLYSSSRRGTDRAPADEQHRQLQGVMRMRFRFALILLGMLGVRTAGAQLVQPAAVRSLTARQAAWPPLPDSTCLACVARKPSRHEAFSDTAMWSAITIDTTGHHHHALVGFLVGAAAGGVIGFAVAQREAHRCEVESCGDGPRLEALNIPLCGFAGAVVGGVIGSMIRTDSASQPNRPNRRGEAAAKE
jgi:hypothetical protein